MAGLGRGALQDEYFFRLNFLTLPGAHPKFGENISMIKMVYYKLGEGPKLSRRPRRE